MKNRLALLLGGLLAVAGSTAPAAPLQRTDVPGTAIWLAHADCDGLRPTVVGQYLLAEMEKPEAQEKFAAFQAIFSFDPRKQLHGLTIFSTGSRAEDPVLLMYADFDPERLATLAKAAKDSQTTTHNQHTIYNWVDEKKAAKDGVQPRTFAAISGRNIIVFGQQEAPVVQALDVLDRTAPGLAATAFPQLGTPGGTSLIEAATQKLDAAATDPSAAVFRLAKRLQLQLGEVSRQVTGRLVLEAGDESLAKTMATVAQGLVGLMKLQANKPDAVKFAESLSFAQDGPNVTISLAMTAEDIVASMKADAARKAKSADKK